MVMARPVVVAVAAVRSAPPAILAPKPGIAASSSSSSSSSYSSSSSLDAGASASSASASTGIAQRQEMLIRQLSQRVAASSSTIPTATATEVCRSLYDFAGEQVGDLPLQRGDLIEIMDRSKGDWWTGRSQRTGRQGCFPSNYVAMM